VDTDRQIARLEALAGPQGAALFAEACALAAGPLTDGAALRVGTVLRTRHPGELVAEVLTQLRLRERAAGRFPGAAGMFLTRAGLEQSSAAVVAQHRAARFAGRARVADLCCGIGGDLLALGAAAPTVAVDRDPVHAWMARRNAAAAGLAERVEVLCRDVAEVDLDGFDAVFVDPARRTARGRLPSRASDPPLGWCLALPERVGAVAVKSAPGLAHAAVPHGWELEFVSLAGELKEAVLWSPAFATTRRRATLLPAGHTLVPGAGAAGAVRAPGRYLLDPDPAVTRAGLVAELAVSLGAWQVDERIAFLSVDEDVRTPFARTLRVIESLPWDQKRLPALLRRLDVGAVDIRRRGLAGDVAALHRSLRLSGSRRATLVMTRCRGLPWALVCLDP